MNSPYIKTQISTYNEYNNSVNTIQKYHSDKYYNTIDQNIFNTLACLRVLDDDNNNYIWNYSYSSNKRNTLLLHFSVPYDCIVKIYLLPLI